MTRFALTMSSLLLSTAACAQSACPIEAEEVADFDWEELHELLIDSPCEDLRLPLAERIEQLLDEPPWQDEASAHHRRSMLDWARSTRLRDALQRRDLSAAAARLQQWRLQLISQADGENAAWERPGDEQLLQRLEQIGAVISGTAPPSIDDRIAAPQGDWLLYFGGCGTPLAMFHWTATTLPDPADAWLALGRPRLAVQTLLKEQWISALSLGTTPPRLRELAERGFGAGAYQREVERALEQIRIDWHLDGAHASMPLFGLQVALPLGHQSWREEEVQLLFDEQAIADYLRPRLLQQADSLD